MALTVFFAVPSLWTEYAPSLRAALDEAGIDAELTMDATAPEAVDYIIYAPGAPLQDFGPFVRAKAVLSLWAGVERIVGNPTLTMPLCRMVDPSLTQGMVEWVTGHALRHHLGMDAHIVNPERQWHNVPPPLARERPVTILGLGELGAACGQALTRMGFPVTGWSRSAKDIPGLRCLAGEDGLGLALSTAQILVLLLPRTPDTENLLDANRLAQLPQGVVILNPGRGALIDDDALLEALDRGHVAQATLDVFRVEPLPRDHPFWVHPKVTVTPHVAADTRPDSSAKVVVENIRRGEAGLPFLHQVDRQRGY